MGKSSASLKKKGSKKSSKAKASSKRKSGKYKSKKVSRREVSLSSSDYDDSTSMDTSMSSSSEDSHRKKRGRSHSRKDVKGHKKVRRRSHSRDSSEDSLYTRKRKKMKRKNEYEVRKKTYQKKKRVRREASVSPGGSGSRSCSTCQGGNSGSDDDSQYESRRGRSERKEKDKRKLKRGRSRNEKSSRHRTRSCSPCTPCSESFAEGAKDKYVGETNSRRLRSVITVTRVAEESGELYRNETNEEIVDDHDYPCRSNDSNDGGTKRESDHHILSSSEEKLRVENEIEDMSADFNFVEPKTIDKSHIDRINFQAYSAGTIETMKETNETGANLDTNDLESILRQRALENLKRFRGEIQSTAKASDQKYKNVNQKKQPITNKHEKVQGKSIVNYADIGTKFSKLTPVEETSFSVSRRNLNANPTNNEIISNMDKDTSSSTMHHLACPQGKVTDAGNLSENVTKSNNCKTNNPKLTKPESHDLLQSQSTLKQKTVSGLPQEQLKLVESTKDIGISAHVVSHSSNDNDNVNVIRGTTSGVPKHSIHSPKFRHNNTNRGKDEVKEQSQFEPKQTSASNKPPNEKYLVSEDDVEKNAANITQAAVQIIDNSGNDVDKSHNSATPKSCIESSSLENNSGNLQDESNPGSQFEQKTMTVMRGGELVQVSYKVYIPKKAPALSRRQLKR